MSYVLATYATYVTKPYILVHTGGSAPLPAVKTQMCYRTVLPIRNMHALAQENTEVCCAYSVVEESVHALGKRGFRQAAVHHPGTHSPFKARNTLGRESESLAKKSTKAQKLSNHPSVQDINQAVHHPGTHSAFKARNTLGREKVNHWP